MDRIILGSGKCYVTIYSGGSIPADNVLEVDANFLGNIKGGATVEYTPSFYEAKDDLGLVAETYLANETASFKTGVMKFNGDTLAKLCATGRVTEDKTNKKRTVKIGGIGNYDGEKYVIRFVHEDAKEGDVRMTIVGSNQSGFTFSFNPSTETVLDCEFKALPHDSEGTLVIYEEEDSTIPDPES